MLIKAFHLLQKAVQYVSDIIAITKIESQIKLELLTLERSIKEGKFENLENVIPEKINLKRQILTFSVIWIIVISFVVFIPVINNL